MLESGRVAPDCGYPAHKRNGHTRRRDGVLVVSLALPLPGPFICEREGWWKILSPERATPPVFGCGRKSGNQTMIEVGMEKQAERVPV